MSISLLIVYGLSLLITGKELNKNSDNLFEKKLSITIPKTGSHVLAAKTFFELTQKLSSLGNAEDKVINLCSYHPYTLTSIHDICIIQGDFQLFTRTKTPSKV